MKIIITESQYKQIIKEESLSTMLLNKIKDDGWSDTAKLVGGNMELLRIVGSNKENIISFFLSCYNDLHIEKRGGEILLKDGGSPLLHKPSELFNSVLRVYDNFLSSRLGNHLYSLYVHFRKDLIKELMLRFPELNSKEVKVYEDLGLYAIYDTYYF